MIGICQPVDRIIIDYDSGKFDDVLKSSNSYRGSHQSVVNGEKALMFYCKKPPTERIPSMRWHIIQLTV